MIRKNKFIFILSIFILSICSSVSVFAANPNVRVDGTNGSNDTREEIDMSKYKEDFDWSNEENTYEAEQMLGNLFLNKAFKQNNIQAAVDMSTPLVLLAMLMTMFIIIIAFYFLISQTAVDLLAILVPITRSFLIRRTQDKGSGYGNMTGGSSGGNFLCLSDAAMEVLGESSGSSGGMGGYGMSTERSQGGSKLLRYVGMKLKEFCVFVVFVMVFFTPLLGVGVMTIFNFCKLLLQGFANMF